MRNWSFFKTFWNSLETNAHYFLVLCLIYLTKFCFKSDIVLFIFNLFMIVGCFAILVLIFLQLFNFNKMYRVIYNSPLSLVVGALGSGKTLTLATISEFQKSKSVYSNFPIFNGTYSIGFNHLKSGVDDKDFPLPSENSLILLDEIFLYLSGNDPKMVKRKWKELIPTFLLARQYGYNMVIAGQRYNQHWVEYREIANLIIKPVMVSRPSFIRPYFKIKYLAFTDPDAFNIYTTESIKRLSNGERVKPPKTSDFMGVYAWTLKIALPIADLYNTKSLSFVRDLKNSNLKDLRFNTWGSNKDVRFSLDDLLDYGMDNLVDNLGYKRGGD